MQIDINGTKIITTLALAIIGVAGTWAWQIQGRLAVLEANADITSRVQTLEELIFPIAVEFKLRERLRDDGLIHNVFDMEGPPLPPTTTVSDAHAPTRKVPPNTAVSPNEIRQNEEDRIRAMIEQRPMKDVRNRRGKPIEFHKKAKDK